MSKIKFCALGGLGETGKNLYVVDVDDKIFILDCGLKFPSVDLYGIDTVIPDISYLVNNSDKIQGVFLSHAHEEHCGAIVEVLKVLQVPVFGSHFTISIVENYIEEANLNVKDFKLYRINDDKVLTFGDVSISFFYTTHSVPESFGISINTVDGSIVYAPDFTLTSTKDVNYQTSYNKISELSKNKVLMLASESIGTTSVDRVNSDFILNHTVNDILTNSKRVIFAMFSYDLNRIQKVIDLCVSHGKKIAILGRKTQKIVNVAMNTDYLKIPNENLVNLRFIDDKNDNNDPDLAVIITGNRHEPYFMLQRMITNQDRLIVINEEDNVVIISPPVIGTEKIATRAKDQLNTTGCKVYSLGKDQLKANHADSEDLKMIYQMLKPIYICPIIGEYRHQYIQKNIALDAGYDENNIILLENGEEITFIDGELQQYRNKISVGDVLVDGSIVGDINEVVLKDRECLSQEGAVLIVCDINSNYHRLVSGPKMICRGFISVNNQREIEDDIKVLATDIIEKELKQSTIDWTQLKNALRDGISYEIKSLINKEPIVIPVIIDINGENL